MRMVISFLVFVASAALGLFLASLWVTGVSLSLHPVGFVIAVLVYAVAQAVLSPFFAKMANRYAPAFLGGVGLISTLVALFIATLVPSGGLQIHGVGAWSVATVVVWLVTALATVLLPLLFVKKKAADR
ncbi:MAG: hypothetical protein U0R77_01540 [Mycolicibacterium insubricum]|nr:hypothetical protein [Mycobacterium sp.]